tara:strand:+ start:304 stop:1269 length:966 start_codon:yes stop_codon:yes gene_type:complete
MKTKKPILIVTGEPNSIFLELFFKIYKTRIKNKFKTPIILITSKDHLLKQMRYFKYLFSVNIINQENFRNINNKKINIIDIKFKFNKVFDKISNKSNLYLKKSFEIAIKIMKKNLARGIINGPISKKYFLNKKYLGITEYLAKKTNSETVMLIYNNKFSVSPLTTHLPLKNVANNINKEKIYNSVKKINSFYIKYRKKKPTFAILGLNPHCETSSKFSEEIKIIKPAIKKLKKNKIKINGPFSADTFFSKKNINKFDVVIGMYHDQVLTPMKTLFNFDAINLTLGLPFLRVSPDHGPNESMIGKNKSDVLSLLRCIEFLKN